MALESDRTLIWALNKLPKPTYVSHEYPNLICSLLQQRCQWAYGPLDSVNGNGSIPRNVTSTFISLGPDGAIRVEKASAQPGACEVLPGTIEFSYTSRESGIGERQVFEDVTGEESAQTSTRTPDRAVEINGGKSLGPIRHTTSTSRGPLRTLT
jgi:hypothetical protein